MDFEHATHLSPPEGSENGAPTDVNARGTLAPSPRGRRSPRRWRRWVAAVVALGGLGGSAVYWGTGKDATAQYVTAPVTRGAVAVAVTATGTVNPVTVVMVGTYVSGRVERLYCDYNTPVRAGQLCAKIDPRPFQMVVDQMRATVAVQKAQLAKDRANLQYAKTTLERDRHLQQRGIVAQAIVDNDESLYGQAQAQIALDESNIQSHQAELHAAEVNLGYTNIIAPVDGTVVSRSVEIGQTVAASFQTPILFLVATDLTKMQVDTSVSESDIGGVKVGDRATFTVQAFPNRPFEGRVRHGERRQPRGFAETRDDGDHADCQDPAGERPDGSGAGPAVSAARAGGGQAGSRRGRGRDRPAARRERGRRRLARAGVGAPRGRAGGGPDLGRAD